MRAVIYALPGGYIRVMEVLPWIGRILVDIVETEYHIASTLIPQVGSVSRVTFSSVSRT